MPAPYTKPHLGLPAQVRLLASRGLVIPDPQHAERVLQAVGYYRLSGYWYPYRQPSPTGMGRADEFVSGTSLDQIIGLYDFDRRLKLHLLDALERIEIAARVQVGHVLGRRGAYAHLDPANLFARFDQPLTSGKPSRYQEWLRRMHDAQQRSREDFVEHFRAKYDDRLPAWVVTEILDFGGVSTLYSGLKSRDRDEIAADFGALDSRGRGNGAVLTNWLRVINYLRNTCAPHSRLWNRNMDVQLATAHLRSIGPLAHLRTGPTAQVSRVFRSPVSRPLPPCGGRRRRCVGGVARRSRGPADNSPAAHRTDPGRDGLPPGVADLVLMALITTVNPEQPARICSNRSRQVTRRSCERSSPAERAFDQPCCP